MTDQPRNSTESIPAPHEAPGASRGLLIALQSPLYRMESAGFRKPTVITGSFDSPPAWFSGIFLSLGLVLAYVMGMSTFRSPHSVVGWIVGLSVMLAFGGGFTSLGLWLFWLRRRLKAVASSNDLAEDFGLTGEQFAEVIESEGIGARYLVNGVALYDRTDFERALLLRPADGSGDSLLRAAGTGHDSAARQLVRPMDETAATPRSQAAASMPEQLNLSVTQE